MEEPAGREGGIELFWRQTAPGEWRAVLIDRKTGARYEVCSERELLTVLRKLLRGQAASSNGEEDGQQAR